MMNLSSTIPRVDVSELARRFLESVKDEYIHVADNHVDFVYRISREYLLLISVFNEIRNSESPTRKDYLDMLFEDMNELEVGILTYDGYEQGARHVFSKNDYPFDVLGLPSKKFLSLKDNSHLNKYFYTVDSIQYVIEYLCILYAYDESLLESKDF